MKYVVIERFRDLQDNEHVYEVGDKFPHSSKRVKKERLEELKTVNNRIGKPLIQEVGE